jgi:hypothetical protein
MSDEELAGPMVATIFTWRMMRLDGTLLMEKMERLFDIGSGTWRFSILNRAENDKNGKK